MSDIEPKDITVDPEFRDLIPPLAPEELEKLEKSMAACGMISPLVVWKHEGENILVDGHNRLALWIKRDGFDTDYRFLVTDEIQFSDREDVKQWIIEHQLGRRNLTPDNYKMLLGRLHQSRKKEKGGDRGNQYSEAKDQNEPLAKETTAEVIAREHNVSPATVKRAAKLAEAVDEIKLEQPGITESEAIPKAKEKLKKPKAKPKPESLEAKLNKRWERFIADIPVVDHRKVREWVTARLKEEAL